MQNENKLGNYIKKIREDRSLTLRELEELTGISYSYLGVIERGIDPRSKKPISPTFEIVTKIAKGLKIPVGRFLLESGQVDDWDYTGANPDDIASIAVDYLKASGISLDSDDVETLKVFTKHLAETKTPRKLSPEEIAEREIVVLDNGRIRPLEEVLDEINALPLNSAIGAIKVPVIGSIRVVSGVLTREEYLSEELVDMKNLKNCKPDSYFWLQVKDDGMQPEIYPGDKVLVCEQSDIDYSGQLAVVIVNNEEGVIRRVHKSNGSIMIHSVNPSYPPRLFSGTDLFNIRIAGKVVEIKRKIQ